MIKSLFFLSIFATFLVGCEAPENEIGTSSGSTKTTYSGEDIKSNFNYYAKTKHYPKEDVDDFSQGYWGDIIKRSTSSPTESYSACDTWTGGRRSEYSVGSDSNAFDFLTNLPDARGEDGCNKGYSLHAPAVKPLQENVNAIIKANLAQSSVESVELPNSCYSSNCVTASYLAFVKKAAMRPDWEQKKNKLKFPSRLYKRYASWGTAKKPMGLKGAMQEFYGSDYDPKNHYHRLRPNNIAKAAEQGVLQQGDIIQMFWVEKRNGSYGGEHMGVFDKMENGKMCFWSSNSPSHIPHSRGTGRKCVSPSRMNNLDVAKI